MCVTADVEIPATYIALAEALERHPTLTCRLEQSVDGSIGDGGSHLWCSIDEDLDIESILRSDPSIGAVQALHRRSGEGLYEATLEPGLAGPRRFVADNGGTMLEATGRDGAWELRLRFPDRSRLSAAHAAMRDSECPVTVRRVTGLAPGKDADLTDPQREALDKAYELGYYDVPRETSLKELAAELDISHQALSERLRRGQGRLVHRELRGRNVVNSPATTPSSDRVSTD